VEGLQRLRDNVGKSITIKSGYRSWKRNKEVYALLNKKPTASQHCGGRAADIKIQGLNSLEIGKAAIDSCGPNIGIGLANTFAHIDIRDYASAWKYGDVDSSWVEEIKRYQQEKGGTRTLSAKSTAKSQPTPRAAQPPAELIRFAQRVLNAAEGERLKDDGDLGPHTREALERFRKKYNLGAGGALDNKTQLALAQRVLEELAQQSLFEKGKRNAATDRALSEFKSQRGLGAEPTLDASTRTALADALEQRTTLPGTLSKKPVLDWTQIHQNQRMRYVMNLLVTEYQYPVNGAAGIVGNLFAESQVIPNRIQGSKIDSPMTAPDWNNVLRKHTPEEVMKRNKIDKIGPGKHNGGIGLAQWTLQERRDGLFKHKQLGAAILYNMDAQVDYLVYELSKKNYKEVDNILRRANVSLEEASDKFVYNFEEPGSVWVKPGELKLPRDHPAVKDEFKQRREYSQHALRAYTSPSDI
jgi:peptidoglycan hydrolase-like protein with peptidoglycan-binding domain